MVLLKRQKIVYRGLPGPVASFQQQAAGGEHPPDAAEASSSSNGGGPPKKKGADEVDDADKKEEVVSAKKEVYYLAETGEIFLDYESYAGRMAFYKQKTFQCEVTGHSNLDYFQACRSEEREARLLHERFPSKLKGPLLRAVQFQLIGRMDKLIDVVHDRFANRFFNGERVFVDVNGDKYHAQVVRTHQPPARATTPVQFSPVKPGSPSTNSTLSLSPPPSPNGPHVVGSDLRLSQEDADRRDPPLKYTYSVQLVDVKGRVVGKDGEAGSGEGTSWMEVRAEQLSRDRLAFSKSILKRFLRDCLDRDATAATSPWIVKPALAAKYGIPTELSAELTKEIDQAKEAASKRRKRKPILDEEPAAEDTEGDSKIELGEDGLPLPPKKRKRRTKAELIAAANGGVMPDTGLPPTPERKKPVKYPAEDFLCSLTPKEVREGKPIKRPLPHRELPFGAQFEQLILTWNFLNSFGKTLVLSPFSLDDYESSLEYNLADPVHPLTVEIHATLLNLISRDSIITRPIASGRGWTSRTAAPDAEDALGADGLPLDPEATLDGSPMDGRSVDGDNDAESAWRGPHGLTETKVVTQAQEVARKATWMSGGELRVKDSRRRWESWLVGCIVDRADQASFPKHLDYLADLLFTDEEDDEDQTPSWTVTDSPVHESGPRPAMPSTRYHLLKPEAKLEIIAFLCELAMQTKVARDAMEESTSQLTEVRKEIQDVKRDRRKVAEDRLLLDPTDKPEGEAGTGAANGAHPPSSINGDAMSVDEGMPINGRGKVLPGDDGDSELSGLSGDEDDDGTSRVRAKSEADDGQSEMADESRIESEMDDISETASVSSRPARPMGSLAIRQQALKAQQQAKEAEAAARAARIAEHRAEVKAKTANSKQLSQERRRLEDEDARLAKREEALARDFRKQHNLPRARPLGIDRFGNKVWWFDGMGSTSLIGPGGVVLYGTGRLFLQGADPKMRSFWGQKSEYREDEILKRRLAEEGEEGMLKEGEWVVYEDPAEITEFFNWLNPKGNREIKLIDAMRRWWDYIHRGAERRWNDLHTKSQVQTAAIEQRRSTRAGQAPDLGKHHSSLQWRNRKADPGPR